MTFYWPRFVDAGAAASTRGPFVFIKPKHRGDEGLYQHEMMHVKQWAFITLVSALLLAAVYPAVIGLALGVSSALYMAVPPYRLWAEVQAYKKQLRYYPDDKTNTFATFIAHNYALDVSIEDARALLKK